MNSGEELAYSGSKRFNNVNVNGSLLLCGSWTVKEGVAINANGLFEMNGTLVVGRNNRQRNITINSGATLIVEGDLVIYGNLVLNDGASIAFLGDDSVIAVTGEVIKNGDVTVTGNFNDYYNKF